MLEDEALDIRRIGREQDAEQAEPITVAAARVMIEDDAAAQMLERRADIRDAATTVERVQIRARDPLIVLPQVPPDDGQRLGAIAELLPKRIERMQPTPPPRG